MIFICILAVLFALIYVDFTIWYCVSMDNLWSEKKRKFRGILSCVWDFLVEKIE